LLSVLNRSANLDANQTINIERAVADQTSTPKFFPTVPWAMAFEQESYVCRCRRRSTT
jgi:hypothetical protein